ncbi:MAG: PQQ-binding-like beta-propeller repeat protein, partial [Phycisphaerae bacterium]
MSCRTFPQVIRTPVCVVSLLAILAVSAVAAAPQSAASDWPGFRGGSHRGVVSVTTGLSNPDGFHLAVAWKQALGSGYSGVATADGTAVTMFAEGGSDVVVALDAQTGRERWRFVLGSGYKGHDGSHDGPISTPLIAGGRVFALSAQGRLVALNLASGAKVWSTDLVTDQGAKQPFYGFSTSPLFVDGVVVVQIGAAGGGAVAGFDPATGKRLWQVGKDSIQYQSPIVWELFGRRQVIAAGNKKLFGVDPARGELLWTHRHGGSGPRGVASMTPVPAGDGRLFLAYKDDESTLIDLAPGEKTVSVKTAWKNRSIRNSYNVPVYHDGYVYAFSSRFLTCVDAGTGKRKWRSRQPGDGFLILVDGHLVILTKEGNLHIARADPTGYKEAARLPVFDGLAWSNPSFADGSVFVRSLSAVARVDIRGGTGAAAGVTDVRDTRSDSSFARFVAEVRAASDKRAVVDRFIAECASFPLIEKPDRLHFIYRGEGSDLAVAGDMFGARQERPMTRVEGTDLFYYSMRLEPDARVNYLFMKDYEEIMDPRNPRRTSTLLLGKEMEMSFSGEPMEMTWVAMPEWKPPAHLSQTAPPRRGRVESRTVNSALLNRKHAIDVYLPAGYDESKDRYPVAYIHGGKDARQYGRMAESLDHLIGERVAPVVVVFIQYAPSPWGGPGKYAEMFAKELIPFVDKNYRTLASPEARASVGMGFGGFSALFCAFHEPGVVGKVATQSAFVFGSSMKTLAPLIKSARDQPLSLYMDWGKYDFRNPHEAWDMGETNRRLVRLLREKGYKPDGGEVYDGTG